MVPFDDKSPFVTSGIRLGTPALTTRGLNEGHMKMIVDFIDQVINNPSDEKTLELVANQVNHMMVDFPIFKR